MKLRIQVVLLDVRRRIARERVPACAPAPPNAKRQTPNETKEPALAGPSCPLRLALGVRRFAVFRLTYLEFETLAGGVYV
jgi:hypothetical protein